MHKIVKFEFLFAWPGMDENVFFTNWFFCPHKWKFKLDYFMHNLFKNPTFYHDDLTTFWWLTFWQCFGAENAQTMFWSPKWIRWQNFCRPFRGLIHFGLQNVAKTSCKLICLNTYYWPEIDLWKVTWHSYFRLQNVTWTFSPPKCHRHQNVVADECSCSNLISKLD